LDGAGVAVAYFDESDTIIVKGIRSDDAQQAPVEQLVRQTLAQAAAAAAFETRTILTTRPTSEILTAPRDYTAPNLDEVWVERLFFDTEGILTVSAFVTSDADKDPIRKELKRGVDRHPRFQGHVQVIDLLSAAKPTAPAKAIRDRFANRPPLTP